MKYAGSILPLTKHENIDRKFGTRHRAALGITEETDSVSIVVSEERGTISVAFKGNITSELDADMLRDTLYNIFQQSNKPKRSQDAAE